MTSGTDDLRRMLDERGVEHGDVESAPYPPYNSTRRMTTFHANKCVWQYIEYEREGGDIELEGRYMSMSVTPEQAIAAALGVTDARPTQEESSGTCHDEGDPSDFCCSECGVRMFTNTSDTYTMIASDGRTIIKHPNYCPNCGRRIVQ